MKQCSEPGCRAETKARGLCSRHYQQLKKLLRSIPIDFVAPQPPANECDFDGCDRPARRNRAHCHLHCRQLDEKGVLKPLRATRRRSTCEFPDCRRAAAAKGLCKAHHSQMRKGKTLKSLRPVGAFETCTHPGCNEKHQARGFCYMHYRRDLDGRSMDRPTVVACEHCDAVVKVPRTGAVPKMCKPCRQLHSAVSWQFGISAREYHELAASQGHVCAICKRPAPSQHRTRRLHVDHDHATGEVRGLLCGNCNIGIGNLKDDPQIMRAAAEYIERHSKAKAS